MTDENGGDLFINGVDEEDPNHNALCFHVDPDAEPIIALRTNGDILIRGSLAENDKQIVDSMRDFLRGVHVAHLGSHEELRERIAEVIYRNDNGMNDADYEADQGKPRRAWKTAAPWDRDPNELSEWERDEYRMQAEAVLKALGDER